MLIRCLLSLCMGALPVVCMSAAVSPRLAPTPVFGRLDVADGLPSSVVYKIAQDRDGFVWFGTQDGLARYDGVGFRIWRNDPGDAHSLAGNQVSVLFADRANQMWVGSDDAGLSVLDARRGSFRRLRHDAADPNSLPADDVWAIAQDREDAIWIGTYSGGLARFSSDGRRFEVLRKRSTGQPDSASLGSDTVLSLLATAEGELWIGSDIGIDRRAADGRIEHVALDVYNAPGRPLHVLGLAIDGDGVIAATGAGLLRIDAQLRVIRLDAAAGVRKLYGFAQGKDADLWLATRHGAVRRQPDGSEVGYPAQALLPGGLPGEALFDVLADSVGGIWFAALDGGVAHLPAQWRRFSQFRELPGVEASLFHGRVSGVGLASDGRFWLVNSGDGLARLDPATGNVEHFDKFAKGEDTRLRSVHEDRQGRLWLGQQRGLRLVDIERGSMRDFPVDAARADALPAAMIDQFAETADAFWISARGACLMQVDPHNLALKRFEPGADSGLRSSDVSQMSVSPNGQLWIAHDQGLDRFDAKTQRFLAQAAVPAERVHAFAFAMDGSLWLHRFGALEHYAVEEAGLRLLQRIDASAGWPAVAAGGLVIDARSRLWVTTPRGLYRVDPLHALIRHYDASAGLLSPEFIDRSLRLRADGVLFAATLAGIVALDTTRSEESAAPTAVQWTAVSVGRDDARIQFDPRAPVNLRWNDRDLRVQARALEFAGRKRYQFRLDPLDRDWSEAAERGEREYSQLRAGDYRLHVRASVDDGPVQEFVTPLKLHRAAPPWASMTAYVSYSIVVFALGALGLLVWRRRIARRHELDLAQQRRALAEQASAAKSDFLAHMGHEIRTPMTGLLGMTDLLVRSSLDERQRTYAAAIRSSGEQMLRLVNDALDLARIEAGRLDLDEEPYDPGALMREVGTVAIALAERKGIAMQWEYVDKDIPSLIIGDARRVRQILLNLIGNAVKFTSRGGVELSLARRGDDILCWSVRDSGPGIPQELRARLFGRYEQGERGRRAGGSGLGLAICRELTDLMHGTIELSDAPGGGSLFEVCLPLIVAPDVVAVESGAAENLPLAPRGAAVSTLGILDLLLVEDDALAARVVGDLLRGLGHTVRHAANGLAGISELTARRPHLALLDLDLPGIDGLQVARLWRKREVEQAETRLPLVALTARSGIDTEQQIRAAGMDHLLRKPVDQASLAAMLEALLATQLSV